LLQLPCLTWGHSAAVNSQIGFNSFYDDSEL
jgi:hypothetical protein